MEHLLNLLEEAATSAGEAATSAPADIIPEVEDLGERIEEASSFFSKLWNGFVAYIPTLIAAVVIFILGYILSKIIIAIMKKGMNRKTIDVTVSHFVFSLVKIVIYVLLAATVLTVLGVPITSIIAVMGTAGVAIGLALQDSLSNVAGGFTILFNKPFKIGDYIQTDGVEGTVEVINIWYTQILTFDKKTIFIPNGQLVDSKITNFTTSPTRRVDMVFSISYDADYKKAISVLKGIADNHPLVLKDPEPLIRLTAQSESSIDLAFRVWVNNSDYWTVFFDMNEAVKDRFDEEGIEIPYKQLDVHIREK